MRPDPIPTFTQRALELQGLDLPESRIERRGGKELWFYFQVAPGRFGRLYACLLKLSPDSRKPELVVVKPDLHELAAGKSIPHIFPHKGRGTKLCLPVCPVDCISLENVTGAQTGWAAWSPADAEQARERYEFSSLRRKQNKRSNDKKLEILAQAKLSDLAGHSKITDPGVLDRKRSIIEAALASARAKRDANGRSD